MEIAEIYEKVMRENDGKCTTRKLAVEARIDKTSAHKAILFYAVGMIPSSRRRGHGRRGVGSLKGLTMRHHEAMYYCYTKRPSRPIDGYVLKLQKHFGITVSNSLVSRWFHSIGPFKGSKVEGGTRNLRYHNLAYYDTHRTRTTRKPWTPQNSFVSQPWCHPSHACKTFYSYHWLQMLLQHSSRTRIRSTRE